MSRFNWLVRLMIVLGLIYWGVFLFAQPIFHAYYLAMTGIMLILALAVVFQYASGPGGAIARIKDRTVDFTGQLVIGIFMTHIGYTLVLVVPFFNLLGLPVLWRQALLGNAVLFTGLGAILHLTALDLDNNSFLNRNWKLSILLALLILIMGVGLIYANYLNELN